MLSVRVNTYGFKRRVDNFLGHEFTEFFRNPGNDAMLKINRILAEEFDPYVPRQMGEDENDESYHMADNVEVTADAITYPGPYAHYMYEGIVYGPNFPIYDKNGNFIGWRSPPGKRKYPTGRTFNYTNPEATSHWVDVALNEKWESIQPKIRNIIIEAWKNGH